MSVDKITTLISRLKKIGIIIELSGNYPWIYLSTINGIRVQEKYMAEHGYTIALYPKVGEELDFLDIPGMFKIIRKYISS